MKMKRWVVLRRISQTVFLILFVYILWSPTYPLDGPISPQILFKINPLIMIFTSISERTALPGIIFAVVMLALTLVFGRFFCGWLCPLGSTIDLIGCFRRGNRKTREEVDSLNAKVRKPKFILLAAIALFAVAGTGLAWIFDPMVIFARFISLGISSYFFPHSFIIFLFFAVIYGSALAVPRLWCRSLCPLGAIYAVTAKTAPLGREVRRCKNYRRCKSICRMGAIRDDSSYAKGECILCMDCVYDCPANITRFVWPANNESRPTADGSSAHKEGITRRDVLLLSALATSSLGFDFNLRHLRKQRSVIRPPAALEEEKFINRCIRCGNCMKVCPTNGLQPASFQSGFQGVWTPQLVPEIGYCEYDCTLCGKTCPTGAIRSLSLDQKHDTRLGLAKVDRSICIAWAENRQCIVCEEHCPIPDKAIKLKRETLDGRGVLKPLVDGNLCVGCGTCQNKCPTRPVRAIRVMPF